MKRYRKRPVAVEAARLDRRNLVEIRSWIGGSCDCVLNGMLRIRTLEGVMAAKPGDWIIRGVNGEFYPCRDDIFRKTYEPEAD
ncbi:MAG: hypothetical protein LBQ79_07775 [Deltaproteobacteria bacterium]|jgi:hypothetical protein|nr:hypothetical protein [Deltaproteobacteria bacterium]